jgi:hypothetical protein
LLFGTCGSYGQITQTTDQLSVPISPNRDDVKAIGMGGTQLALGTRFNAMMYNPALLAHRRVSYDVIGVQASLPSTTFDAISFLSDGNTVRELRTGDFLKRIRRGFDQFLNGNGAAEQSAGISLMNSGLKFVNEMQDRVIGPADDPKLQGISVIPNIQVQVDNWGFSLYGILQSGFQSYPTEALSQLYSMRIPENLTTDNLTPEVRDQLLQIGVLILPLFDQNLNLRYQQAIPTTFAMAYLDIVGAVGYGYQITPQLSLGANLKLVNRRVSTKIISSEHYDQILREVRTDFKTSKTGVTLDLGGLYKFQEINTSVAISLQNVIPMPSLNSEAVLNDIVYVQPDPNELPVAQTLQLTLPFEFKVPFLAHIGATHAITPDWDVAVDWVDVASQDESYERYADRFRLGTEYRLEVAPGSFGTAFRLGMASTHFAGGLGLSFWRVVQLDGAYAFDHFIGDDAFYAQIKIGW